MPASSGPSPSPRDVPVLELRPGDTYLDPDGLMVFTRQYLLRRGVCCKSGCRHCPWSYRRPDPAAQGDDR